MLIKLKPETLDRIRYLHPNKWVLLADAQRDASGNLLSGIVLYAEDDQNALYARMKDRAFQKMTCWHTSHDSSARAIDL